MRKQYPIWRIELGEDNKFHKFPKKLRAKLCNIIIKLKKEHPENLSPTVKQLKQRFKSSNELIISWLLDSPRYHEATVKYLEDLIYLMEQFLDLGKNILPLSPTALANDSKVNFSYSEIRLMIKELRNRIRH